MRNLPMLMMIVLLIFVPGCATRVLAPGDVRFPYGNRAMVQVDVGGYTGQAVGQVKKRDAPTETSPVPAPNTSPSAVSVRWRAVKVFAERYYVLHLIQLDLPDESADGRSFFLDRPLRLNVDGKRYKVCRASSILEDRTIPNFAAGYPVPLSFFDTLGQAKSVRFRIATRQGILLGLFTPDAIERFHKFTTVVRFTNMGIEVQDRSGNVLKREVESKPGAETRVAVFKQIDPGDSANTPK